ncbi:PRC-barrel domain-containing protein [Thermincola ferriacetica]|uniref:PRC-barrel domain-containing protein n=1 Tax=Thermincola ferriacetica TaxID=281456 RepID=A0A0L6W0D3_9FIRM|nr:PRC-barrel domain-containing protein [Thermincola ferriacetica]KNZ68906.1 PRC-barrel domain-containing protein [Thermincola ferriacetica]
MRKSRKIMAMPIISIAEGIQIGTVKSLVVDPEQKEIAALVIDQKGWFREQKIIPYSKVSNVGDDAITIDQSSNVEKSTNLPEILKLLREKTDPIGLKVISETGKVLGHVDEYYIDEKSGQIVSLEISGKLMESLLKGKGLLPASQIITMGADAIVVKANTEDEITKVDGGLQETLANLKDSTSGLWNVTRKKTLELSKTIKEKTKEKVKNSGHATAESTKDLPTVTGTGSAKEIPVPPEEEETPLAETATEAVAQPNNLVPNSQPAQTGTDMDAGLADEQTVPSGPETTVDEAPAAKENKEKEIEKTG